MDSEVEKYKKKERQLQEQVKELFSEKKILQDKICVLQECLSLEKVKQKVSELENKQKILKSLESMIINLKNEIKPLEYLKQLLQRQLMVSSLVDNDINIKDEQNNVESSQLTINSGCAIENLDSLSDVSSEESIMVLSEYDVISDDEVINNTEKTVPTKVLYTEALQMATSQYSSLNTDIFESSTNNNNNNNKIKDTIPNVQSNFKDNKILMSTSSKSDQLLELYDVVNEQDLLNCNANNEIELQCNTAKIEPIKSELYVHDKLISIDEIKLDCDKKNLSKLNNDFWVKVNTDESNENSIKRFMNNLQESYETEKKNIVLKANTENHMQIDYQCNSKDKIIEVESNKNVCNNVYRNLQNRNNFLNFSTTILKEISEINNMLLNSVDAGVLKESCEPKIIIEVENTVQNNQFFDCHNESRDNIIEIKSLENVHNHVDNSINNEINQPISSTNMDISKDEIEIKNASLINIEDSNILKNCVELSANINTEPSSIIIDEKPTQLSHFSDFINLGLNIKLLNGIHQHGFQDLIKLQMQCISHCINGHDIILHSYPCTGKSIMSFILVLQRIDTCINKCQAIILVPTLELAFSAQKVIESFGQFLNVSTCIGGSNIPLKISPVPHIVVSTPYDLCDMIDCNSLCKDFIQMLVIDDADEMLNGSGYYNQIRQILLFLNNDRQLIILSNSKLEEILDQFSDVLHNPEYIIEPDIKPSLNNVLQYFVQLSEEWKFDIICELYEELNLMNTVVFCNTWNKSLGIAENMRLKTYTVSVVHNEMDSSQRRLILRQFRSGISKVLVTTGLLKGEDFSDVVWVINYDFPKCPKDYVRRILGYFNCKVKVVNFITTNDVTAKENIETEFNIHMKLMPNNLTDLCVSNLNSNDDPLFNLLEL